MGYIIIKTTFANKKDAQLVARKMVDNKLAACIQLSEIESYYRWKGKTESASEYKLDIKTLSKNYKKIEEMIKKSHKYDVPEIIAIKIKKGSKDYLNWIDREVI